MENEKEFYKKLREKLDFKRVQCGYSFAVLSQRTGIPSSTLKDYLSGKTTIPIYRLIKVSKELDIPLYELLEQEPNKTSCDEEVQKEISAVNHALHLVQKGVNNIASLTKKSR